MIGPVGRTRPARFRSSADFPSYPCSTSGNTPSPGFPIMCVADELRNSNCRSGLSRHHGCALPPCSSGSITAPAAEASCLTLVTSLDHYRTSCRTLLYCLPLYAHRASVLDEPYLSCYVCQHVHNRDALYCDLDRSKTGPPPFPFPYGWMP